MKIAKFIASSIALSGALGWIGACSSTVTQGDSESHFLSTCPPGCPSGLECICGTCTRACVTDSICGSLGTNVTCVEHANCGTPKTCDVKCSTAPDCVTPGAVCDKGVCRRGVSQKDGGTGGAKGDDAATPNDVSSIPNPDVYVPPRKDASTLPRCEQPVDTRSCESGELIVHEPPPSNACVRAGAFVCPNNDNGFSSIAECLSACPGSYGDAGAPFGDAGSHPPVPVPPSILDWDGGPFSLPDGSIMTCWFPGEIQWLRPLDSLDRLSLAAPNFSRTSYGHTCNAPLPDCGAPGVTPRDIGNALLDPDVQTLLASNGGLGHFQFGKIQRRGMLDITFKDGLFAELLLGEPCDGEVGCTDAPAGVARLRDVLLQVEFQQLGRGDCRPRNGCLHRVDPGPCTGNFKKFAYNPGNGTCEEFTYGGCEGSLNNFDTKEACEAACAFDPCLLGSKLLPDGGGCSGTTLSNEDRRMERCFTDKRVTCACVCALFGGEVPSCTPLGPPPECSP